MLRGLEGRRIAVSVPTKGRDAEQDTTAVFTALEGAGAIVHRLSAEQADEDWHGTKYAALVVTDVPEGAVANQKVIQLIREFLASEKPVAAYGNGLTALLEAGGGQGRTIAAAGRERVAAEGAGAKLADTPIHVDGMLVTAASGADIRAFAATVVRDLSDKLEEHELDEMSDQSFPASDPPATSPASVGHVTPDRP